MPYLTWPRWSGIDLWSHSSTHGMLASPFTNLYRCTMLPSHSALFHRPLYMFTFIRVIHASTRSHVYMFTWHLYMFTFICVIHICTRSHVYTFTSMHVHVFTCSCHLFTSIHVHIYKCSHVIYTHSHLYTFTSINIHMSSIHIHIYTSSHL